jgi:hypothetical protein
MGTDIVRRGAASINRQSILTLFFFALDMISLFPPNQILRF